MDKNITSADEHFPAWKKPANIFAFLVGIGAFSLYALAIWIYWREFMETPLPSLPEDGFPSAFWGQFGDFIGGILNPLFAIFTFSGLIYTIIVQREELKLQRKELSISNNALHRSKEIADDQLKHIQRDAKKMDLRNTLSLIDQEISSTLKLDNGGSSIGSRYDCIARDIAFNRNAGYEVRYYVDDIGNGARVADLLVSMNDILSEYFGNSDDRWMITYYADKYRSYAQILIRERVHPRNSLSWFN